MTLPVNSLHFITVPTNPRIKLLPDGPFIEIDGGSLYLGRDCHLALHIPALLSKLVSNRHCSIKADGRGHWNLEDLGSTNGTWLRDERVSIPTALTAGDLFSMGRAGPRFEWLPPKEAAVFAAEATMLEEDFSAAPTSTAVKPDGSDERPYRVGKTPEVTLHHLRSNQHLGATGYTIVIGRDPESAQILVRSESEKHVSGRHVEISFRADHSVVVRDLGSSNGTWVNEQRLKGEARLKVGDRLVLGLAATTLLVTRLEW